MPLASSIPCIKIPTSSSSPSCTSSTSSYSFRFSSFKVHSVTIRNSKAEGPIRRPVAPPVREPSSSAPQPLNPTPPTVAPTPQKLAGFVGDDKNVITLEFQRQKAKELQQYFKQKKLDEAADQGPLFGFIGKNEINNGRWAMFGFAVGLLTEYATGSDFVDQVKILFSNFGILDLE